MMKNDCSRALCAGRTDRQTDKVTPWAPSRSQKVSFQDSFKIMSYTLRTALCCSVSSLNSFQELVIGEKSLEGVPENSLFIPVKEEILDLFSILIFWEMGENFM